MAPNSVPNGKASRAGRFTDGSSDRGTGATRPSHTKPLGPGKGLG